MLFHAGRFVRRERIHRVAVQLRVQEPDEAPREDGQQEHGDYTEDAAVRTGHFFCIGHTYYLLEPLVAENERDLVLIR